MIKALLSLLIILLVGVLPKINNKNKFRIEMFTNGILNKFILLSIIVYISTLNPTIGILLFTLVFSLIFTGHEEIKIKEGFKNYFQKKNSN